MWPMNLDVSGLEATTATGGAQQNTGQGAAGGVFMGATTPNGL